MAVPGRLSLSVPLKRGAVHHVAERRNRGGDMKKRGCTSAEGGGRPRRSGAGQKGHRTHGRLSHSAAPLYFVNDRGVPGTEKEVWSPATTDK